MISKKIVVGVTGASGAPYVVRFIQLLLESGSEVHLAVSTLGRRLLFEECAIHDIDADSFGVSDFSDRLFVYNDRDLGSRIASGTFVHDGMFVLPCSSNTLGAIASGITNTLVQRAAAVALKERRRLVLAHRETPLSPIDLKNMCIVTNAGAIIAPLSPGFYMTPTTIPDLVDFMAGKLVDLVDIDHRLPVRWDPVAEQ